MEILNKVINKFFGIDYDKNKFKINYNNDRFFIENNQIQIEYMMNVFIIIRLNKSKMKYRYENYPFLKIKKDNFSYKNLNKIRICYKEHNKIHNIDYFDNKHWLKGRYMLIKTNEINKYDVYTDLIISTYSINPRQLIERKLYYNICFNYYYIDNSKIKIVKKKNKKSSYVEDSLIYRLLLNYRFCYF